jgi:hypothetical protein
MLFLGCRKQRPAAGIFERHVRSFRNIDLSDLLEVASGLDWSAVRFISDFISDKIGRFWSSLNSIVVC